MGSRGPLAKPGAQGHRPHAQVVALPTRPDSSIKRTPPRGLLPTTRKDWREFWESDVARAVRPHHLPALRRLFQLRDKFARAMQAADLALMVKGSTGQVRVNPALESAIRLDASIVRLENELGLTPMSEARLGITVGQAQMTLEELNRAAAAIPDEDEDPAAVLLAGPDPRRKAAT